MTTILTAILGLLIGLILGAVICAIFIKNKTKKEYEKRIDEVKTAEKEHYETALKAKDEANAEAMRSIKEHYAQSMDEQQKRFDETVAKIAAQNKAATEEMLKARQKEFAETSSANIGQIVTPLKETIAKMEETMQKSSKEAVSINSAMRENLEQMIKQSKATQATTEELTNAFKHKSKVQGDWGETVLTELLTSQGLTEGVHFETQATIRDAKGESVKNEEGNRMRPDVIIHLDQKRVVVVDSKVSLTAFFDYVNA
ncbi:MAG: DNA recombination protein RmuC, partial [Bacteroidales bacterium]|nr:DNA recombination protein RmuC [Bacteroidales bacterium]